MAIKKTAKIYGYCRISTKDQSIERQIRNIKEYNKDAYIFQEAYTGTKLEGRKEFQRLLKRLKEGDTIIFDSVSRMSRNSEEGFSLYKKLYNEGISLIFLKEPHINTETYKMALKKKLTIETDSKAINAIIDGINEALLLLAEEQIKIAFDQSEKEVQDLRKRTREGMDTAREKGKQIGQIKGSKLTTKKSIECKERIRQLNKSFNGSLTDKDTIKLLGIARNTFYKYKREIMQEEEK